MAHRRWFTIVLANWVLWLGIDRLGGQESERPPEPVGFDRVQRLADRIDELVAARWEDAQVTPAPLADDAEYLRRVYLDIAGKIPPTSEVRRFLADTSPHKRREVVEHLLQSSAHLTHFTNKWRSIWMPESTADFQIRYLIPSFEVWLRGRLAEGVTYDQIVREILTLPMTNNSNGFGMAADGNATPAAYYQAKQLKPENLAAATSRMFLGIRIECAQCHDHPFDEWKREQFWSFAAFYGGLERETDGAVIGVIRELFTKKELTIPDTNTVVKPTYLNGQSPVLVFRKSPRSTLADWMTSAQNPYFARAVANRMWAHFFGIGIVDPVDDFSSHNPPSHPELLAKLSSDLAAEGFDIRFLIRAITTSRTYQLTSLRTDPSQDDPRVFARMAVRGLTSEQLVDSLAQAIGRHEPFNPQQAFIFADGSPSSELRDLFTNESSQTLDKPTTILQALALMNGQMVAEATELSQSRTLTAVAEYPLLDTGQRIEALYLATLSRLPREDELARLVSYVDRGGVSQNQKTALGDVFWSLLNSSEFMLNH